MLERHALGSGGRSQHSDVSLGIDHDRSLGRGLGEHQQAAGDEVDETPFAERADVDHRGRLDLQDAGRDAEHLAPSHRRRARPAVGERVGRVVPAPGETLTDERVDGPARGV